MLWDYSLSVWFFLSTFSISFKYFSQNFNGDIFLLLWGVSNAFWFGARSCVSSSVGSGHDASVGKGVGSGVRVYLDLLREMSYF